MVDTVDTLEARGLPMPNLRPKLNLRDLVMLNPRLNLRLTLMLNMDTMDIPPPMDTMVDIILMLTDMDSTDTDILERDLLMLNLRLMLNLDTMDIHPLMDTMVDIIPVLTDMDTTDTDILERDLMITKMFDKYLI